MWTLPAYSATVVYHGNHVEEINGLVVGAALYDVTFREVEYVTNWLLDSPTFMGDEEGAGAAALAINNILNNESTGIGPVPYVGDAGGRYYLIPYGSTIHTPMILSKYSDSGTGFAYELDPRPAASGYWDDDIYAKFTSVPIPGAIWLLSSGLLGIIGISRKFKK